jgi:predicted MFS family arabinose efflux permease
VVLRLVPSSRSATVRGIDVRGQLLVAGFLATLTYALIEAPRDGFSSGRIVVLLVVAAVLSVAFVLVELRVAEPLLDLRFFRDQQFAGAVVISGTMFFTFAGFIFFNALYLQNVRGYSALAAGFLTLPAALPAVVGGPLSGYLVATRGPRGVLVGGTLALAAGVGLLALLPGDVALGWLLASYLVIGAGYAVLSAPVNTVAVSSMPRDQAAVAAAVTSAARNVGIVLGIAVLGTIVNGRVPTMLTRTSGASQAAFASFQHRYVDALHAAYWVAAIVIFAASLMAALTMRPTPPGAV